MSNNRAATAPAAAAELARECDRSDLPHNVNMDNETHETNEERNGGRDGDGRDIDRLVQQGMRGKAAHDSTQVPFMLPSLENNDASARANVPDASRVNTVLEHVPLPDMLHTMYRAIGSPDHEYIFKAWILMSAHKVKQLYEQRREKGQLRVVDFAFIYAGMGHAVVAAYDPLSRCIFYRVDGGANGWDREHHHAFMMRYVPRARECFAPEHWYDVVCKHLNTEEHTDPFSLPLVKM